MKVRYTNTACAKEHKLTKRCLIGILKQNYLPCKLFRNPVGIVTEALATGLSGFCVILLLSTASFSLDCKSSKTTTMLSFILSCGMFVAFATESVYKIFHC